MSEDRLKYSLDENFVSRLVCDNYRFLALDAGNNRAFFTNRFRSTGECSMVVLKALSFHPEFPDSNFGANSVLSCSGYLGLDGVEQDAYISSVFGLLANMTHAFAAFLVLRSIPVLIRRQGKDGLWQEKPAGRCPPPSKEESTYRSYNKKCHDDAWSCNKRRRGENHREADHIESPS